MNKFVLLLLAVSVSAISLAGTDIWKGNTWTESWSTDPDVEGWTTAGTFDFKQGPAFAGSYLDTYYRQPPTADETAVSAFLVREYGVGDFHRAFQIGEGIDAAKIEAEVNNGVLTLRLPKSEAAKARTIEVKAT